MTSEPTFAGDEVPRLERLSDYLDLHAARCPTREAAVSSSVRLDYRSLARWVERCARALIAVGIERGDRVAVLTTPRPEYLVIFLALARIGALWIGLNPRHRPREHRFVLEDARPRLVIAMSGFDDRDFTEELPALVTATRSVRRLVPLESLDLFCAEGDAVHDPAMTARMGLVGPAGPLCIVYTCGSTGTPKGAMLTHRAFVASYTTQALGDLCLIAGGTQVLMERFDPHALVETMRREQVSVLYQMVAQYQRLAAVPSFAEGSFPTLDRVVWGDGPIPLDLLRLLRTKARHLATSYGLSEACGPLTYSAPDGSDHELSETVGKPAPEYELRLATDGRESVPGEIGEIQVRGEVVMAGYFDRPDATAETIDRAGWLHTGDLAVLRTDGNLALVGRCSEMFKSGGYNIYPREIELVLQSHPGVAFATVVPVPDPTYQTVGHAFLLRRRGADLDPGAIALWCRSELANYKVPKRFIVVDDFPMLPNGKIDRQALRTSCRQGDSGSDGARAAR